MRYLFRAFLLFLLIGVFAWVQRAHATDYAADHFRIRDPVFSIASSTQMSSTNFRLWGSVGGIAIGTSTATNFGLHGGFLYFPQVSSPVVSATAGNAKVDLSWSAAQGFLGWVVSGYNVGQATVSGGPYTFSSSLGNVTTSSRTGLTNGTTYYFIVRAEDFFQNSIATSSEVSSKPVAPAPAPSPSPSPSTTGGGGGGGIISTAPQPTRVNLRGRAFPGAQLTILKDGSVVATPKANQEGIFETSVDVAAGTYSFSVYAIDDQNIRSLSLSFVVSISSGFTTTISDSVISPTITTDKSAVKQGNDIVFSGSAFPRSEISVTINSANAYVEKTVADASGKWNYTFDSSKLETGDHTGKSQAKTLDGLMSPFSESIAFTVGDTDVARAKPTASVAATAVSAKAPACGKNGDVNNDGRVNIIDFSIMLYFWNQHNPKNSCADINHDGKVDLFDFSIMLFWWTG